MDHQVRVGIGVFVFRDGKFLMGKRKGSHGADTWSIPGGHLEFGETPEETACREVMEETGLKVCNVRFGAMTNDHFKNEDKHYVTLWMICDHEEGEPQICEPDKYVEHAWHDFDTLPEPLFLPWENLLTSEFIETIKKQLK